MFNDLMRAVDRGQVSLLVLLDLDGSFDTMQGSSCIFKTFCDMTYFI
jgi:hypothetical protein